MNTSTALTLGAAETPVIDYLLLVGGKFSLAAAGKAKALYVASGVTLTGSVRLTTAEAFIHPGDYEDLVGVLTPDKLSLLYVAADMSITVSEAQLTVGQVDIAVGANPAIVFAILNAGTAVTPIITLVGPGNTPTGGFDFTIRIQGMIPDAVIPDDQSPEGAAPTVAIDPDAGLTWAGMSSVLTVKAEPTGAALGVSTNTSKLVFTTRTAIIDPFTPPTQVVVVTPVPPVVDGTGGDETQSVSIAADEEGTGAGTGTETGTQTTQPPVIQEPKTVPKGDDDGGLSGGAIAGIVIGVVAAVGIAGFCVWYFVLRPKKLGVEGAKP